MHEHKHNYQYNHLYKLVLSQVCAPSLSLVSPHRSFPLIWFTLSVVSPLGAHPDSRRFNLNCRLLSVSKYLYASIFAQSFFFVFTMGN